VGKGMRGEKIFRGYMREIKSGEFLVCKETKVNHIDRDDGAITCCSA